VFNSSAPSRGDAGEQRHVMSRDLIFSSDGPNGVPKRQEQQHVERDNAECGPAYKAFDGYNEGVI
jgi:hypothetical protein